MENGVERKILEEMAMRLVAKRSEIMGMFKGRDDVTRETIKVITKSLAQKGLLTMIHTSETSFAITQKGIRKARFFRD